MKFIIANGDQNASKVPSAHQEEVEFFYGDPKISQGKEPTWVADLTAEQLATLCRRSGGHIAIEDRSVKEMRTNSLDAPCLRLW